MIDLAVNITFLRTHSQPQIQIAQRSRITYDSVSGELRKLEEKREAVRMHNPQMLTQDFNVHFSDSFEIIL